MSAELNWFWSAFPGLSTWLVAPLLGDLVSLPRKNRTLFLDAADSEWLSEIASGTWAYFEQYLNEQGNWLPPDNVQEYPKEKVAYRISPTNEGLFLVSGLVASRFGFTGLQSLWTLWKKNLTSWNSLQQFHGHHYNWYQTSTLEALRPRYVSTVDSGNLLASYLTLSRGIEDLVNQPIFSTNHIHGVKTSLRWLKRELQVELDRIDKASPFSEAEKDELKSLSELIDDLDHSMILAGNDLSELLQSLVSVRLASKRLTTWCESTLSIGMVKSQTLIQQTLIVANRCKSIVSDVDNFIGWLPQLVEFERNVDEQQRQLIRAVIPASISLRELAQLFASPKLHNGTSLSLPDFLNQAIHACSEAASDVLMRFMAIREECEAAAMKMEFRFLYSPRQKLFSIGFNADLGRLDRCHYDLLCSEARLASFLAIAKGDIESEHWFRLGRQATFIGSDYTLLSWGGTMFEYLMPQLFQHTYENSLIDTSCQTAISRQIEYGKQFQIPWGISESAYASMASNGDYQYKSFGVPGLGLKRGLSKDIVVSPYSSAIALAFIPTAAADNLKDLAKICLGRWGFYDAVDYTPRRLQRKKVAVVVRNYMTHHHGMTMLALANVLNEQIVVGWFHAHPLVRANELLLQEKVPKSGGRMCQQNSSN